jgi:hypothetical protein
MKISIYVHILRQYNYVENFPAPTRVTKLSDYKCSGIEMLEFRILKKYNKLVKNYFQMEFESADLIYNQGKSKRVIKWVVLLIPLKDMVFGKSLQQTGWVYTMAPARHILSRSCAHPSIPSTANTNFWLVVVLSNQKMATLGQGHIPLSNFWCVAFWCTKQRNKQQR